MIELAHCVGSVLHRPILLDQALQVPFLLLTFRPLLPQLLQRDVLLLLDQLLEERLLRPLQHDRLLLVVLN